jgi:hypothetical protein
MVLTFDITYYRWLNAFNWARCGACNKKVKRTHTQKDRIKHSHLKCELQVGKIHKGVNIRGAALKGKHPKKKDVS